MESQTSTKKTERTEITGKITRQDLIDLMHQKGEMEPHKDIKKALNANVQSCSIFIECPLGGDCSGQDLEIGDSEFNLDIKFKIISEIQVTE